MAYENLTFTPGETLTAAKMNKLQANVAGLRDGSNIGAGAVRADSINFNSFPIQYGGGELTPGTVSKTFTPKSDGLLRVIASGRRNAGNAADLVIYISATGVSNQVDSTGVQFGTGVFASASFVAQVTKGVPVTINVNVSGGSIANSGYQFFVVPGKAEKVN